MIRDKKDLDDFVTRMANGRAAAKASRASSTAPPSPKPASKRRAKAPNPPHSPNENTTVGNSTHVPQPAGLTAIHIHLHKS